jgi:ribosomal protein S2
MVRNNLQQLSTFLFSLGAHIGHIRVDSYHSLSPFIAGERNYFMIMDIQRTIPMLKKALVFYSDIISSFGHSVFCYSCVDMLNIYLKTYFSRIISARNQSFSY